jgi:hypothetical protein
MAGPVHELGKGCRVMADVSARPDPRQVLALARWRQAEEQLFARLIQEPERYELIVRVVGAIGRDLQTRCPTTDSLFTEDPGLVAAEVAAAELDDPAALNLDQLGAAAFAAHWLRLDLSRGADHESGLTTTDPGQPNGMR